MEHGSCGEHGCAAAISVPRIASAYPIFAKCICTAHSIGPISRSFPTVLNPDSPAIINDEAVFVRRLLSYVHRPLRSVIGHILTHTRTQKEGWEKYPLPLCLSPTLALSSSSSDQRDIENRTSCTCIVCIQSVPVFHDLGRGEERERERERETLRTSRNKPERRSFRCFRFRENRVLKNSSSTIERG